ncbi:unnamed protein product [Rodentolepis nana]|uniref:Smoothelin domain-containing protein n=1 Tax=Rodentolepis nana TaxID=102285 RepID=A0A0R3TM74_RODNA|nr:unnamed protein product [Rodentolepis nana]
MTRLCYYFLLIKLGLEKKCPPTSSSNHLSSNSISPSPSSKASPYSGSHPISRTPVTPSSSPWRVAQMLDSPPPPALPPRRDFPTMSSKQVTSTPPPPPPPPLFENELNDGRKRASTLTQSIRASFNTLSCKGKCRKFAFIGTKKHTKVAVTSSLHDKFDPTTDNACPSDCRFDVAETISKETAENDLNCLLRQLEEVENTMKQLELDDGDFTRSKRARIRDALLARLIRDRRELRQRLQTLAETAQSIIVSFSQENGDLKPSMIEFEKALTTFLSDLDTSSGIELDTQNHDSETESTDTDMEDSELGHKAGRATRGEKLAESARTLDAQLREYVSARYSLASSSTTDPNTGCNPSPAPDAPEQSVSSPILPPPLPPLPSNGYGNGNGYMGYSNGYTNRPTTADNQYSVDRVTLRPALLPQNLPTSARPSSPSDYELAEEALLPTEPKFTHVVPHDAGLSGDTRSVSNPCPNYVCFNKITKANLQLY